MTAPTYRFAHRLRVRWAECDMQGIVFNPHYMMYFDTATTEYYRAIGLRYPADLLALEADVFMVASAANYRDAARFDEDIDIRVRTEYLGRTSFRMAFSIERDHGVLVDGTATYVIGHHRERTPMLLPAPLVDAVLAYEPTAPARKA